MDKTSISAKHKKFADEYLKSGDQVAAYQKVYNQKNKEAARVNSYKLLQSTTVQAYINAKADKIAKLTEQKLTEELSNREVINCLSAIEKREILAKIARGELEITDISNTKDGPIEVSRKPNVMERLKAIELENKMTGDIAATNSNVKVSTDLDELLKSGQAKAVTSGEGTAKDFKEIDGA